MAVSAPQKSRKLKSPAPAPAAAPAAPAQPLAPGTVSDGKGGFTITDQAAYSAWHAQDTARQKADTSDPARVNELGTADLQADIARRSQSAEQGFASSISGMDLGGQFAPRGTTPSTAQVFNQTAAANPGAGSGGFSAPLAPARAVSAAGPAPAASLFGSGLSNTPGQAPSKVEQAASQAGDAIGPAPRVDMGLADRRLGEYQEALGMSREVIDRLLNGPNTANAIGARMLENQLAMARSARGGPGAVQQAFSAAQQQAPQLQAQAAQQAQQEELSKLTAAGNVASNFAQAALGARGQDVGIAGKNVDAGLQTKDMITRLTGVQLELDQRNTELIGQMARDLAALQFDWASLTAQQAQAALDRYLQIYQIDQNVRAQLAAVAAQGKITPNDIFNGIVGIVGAGATVGAAAAGKPPA